MKIAHNAQKMLSVFCACLAAGAFPAFAQTTMDWPSRPIRMLVGSAPGGGTDSMARAIADRLAGPFKQPVVVENRPGASNTIAAELVSKSTDGHTMVMGVVTAHAIAPHLLKLNYDSNQDLVPVAFVGSVPNVLVVNNDLAVKSVQELVGLAKKSPGKINYASSGAGSTQHIAAEMFRDASGVDIVHVPYKGSGAAMLDLMGGQVQMSFDTTPSVIGQIKAGKMRPLAVTTSKRSAQLPEVPTIGEAGLPAVEISAWYGIYMPASTPKKVQERVNEEVNKALAMQETKTRLEGIGAEITPMSLAQFAAFQSSEFKRYGEIIRKNGIRVD